jgi:hypothetical protein
MKTARLQVLTTPAFREWLQKEAEQAGVSVGELVRSRCERRPSEDERAIAEMASQLRKEVRKAQTSLRAGLTEAESVLRELRERRASVSAAGERA